MSDSPNTEPQTADSNNSAAELPRLSQPKLKNIIEAALMVAGQPLKLDDLSSLFNAKEDQTAVPTNAEIRSVLNQLAADYAGRGIELKKVATGYRMQAREDFSQWLNRMWEERPSRYSRATLETLALIAYRQPITRGEIEDIRGVSVSSNIVRSLQEREWIRIVGHRDVPGRPAMYGTTKTFLDYFNLASLDELPTLSELRDIDSINAELDLPTPDIDVARDAAREAAEAAHDDNEQAESVEHVESVENIELVEPEKNLDHSPAESEPVSSAPHTQPNHNGHEN